MLELVVVLHFVVKVENRCAEVFISLILVVNLLEDKATMRWLIPEFLRIRGSPRRGNPHEGKEKLLFPMRSFRIVLVKK